MAAISSLSNLINLCTGGSSGNPQAKFWFKSGRIAGVNIAPVAGRMQSLWLMEGQPSAGVTPTTAAVVVATEDGVLSVDAAGAGKERWLIHSGACSTTIGTIVMYDRLLHRGGLSGTVTTSQTVQGSPASPALSRYTDGVGNVMWYEIYTAVGTTATTLTATYIDDTNTSRTSTVTIGGTGNREQSRAQIVALHPSSKGVKSITSVTLSATTGTAGNFGMTIGRPIVYMPVGASGGMGWRDFTTGLPTIPKIVDNTAFAFLFSSSGTTTQEIFGMIGAVDA